MVHSNPFDNVSKNLTPTSSVFALHKWIAGSENVAWLFHPGMLFACNEKWWGTGGVRQSPHEGLDFCYFLDEEDNLKQLDANSRIPVLFDGEIAAVFEDYLGKTVLVKHEQHQLDEKIFFTIYAHISPLSHIKSGVFITFGETLGTVAFSEIKDISVPAHLHLSVAFVPKTVMPETLNWQALSRQPVVLCDPLDVMQINYRQVED